MRVVILAAIAVMIAVCGCSKDTATSPEIVEEIPLAVDTLGAGGGTLEIEDFMLIVPPGAFGSTVELSLYESKEDHGFGDNAVSRFFRIEGLPEEFADSLVIRIRYQGTLSGETYIAVGMDEEVLSDEDELVEETLYNLISASEDSGFLEGKL